MSESASDSSPSASSDRSTDAVTVSTADAKRIGVFSPHNSAETKAICNAIEGLGHEPVWIRERNFSSRIENGSVRLTPDVDVVINRTLLTKSDRPVEDLHAVGLYADRVPVLNPPSAIAAAAHKYRAATLLAGAGIRVPDAFFARSVRRLDGVGWPGDGRVVQKHTVGTNGRGMRLLRPESAPGPTLDDRQTFLQAFVPGTDDRRSDVRVYVVGGRVLGAMRRYATEEDWRTNVALGGDVEDVTEQVDDDARRLARRATAALGLDYAGVDLIRGEEGWQLLEVNATAGFKGFFRATGCSPAPSIAALAIERVGGTPDEGRLEALAGRLDDSVPPCAPTGRADPPAEVLGYTTRVRLAGSADVESVIAKSDTGAKRTSVDTRLAGRIGLGPIVGNTRVRSGTADGHERRPLVPLEIRIGDRWRTVTASVSDRGGMNYPVLLGRDVLEDYRLKIGKRAEE